MPQRAKELSALAVKRLTEVGFYFLGGVPGFALKVQKNSASYVLRYSDAYGKKHDVFIGPRSVLSLSQARGIALELKAKILAGRDPLEEKKQARQKIKEEKKQQQIPNFEKVANDWLKDRARNGFFRNNPEGEIRTFWVLNRHIFPKLGSKSINAITPEMIRDIIGPLWETKTNTAQKALTYLRQIFNWSIALRIREDRENPADLRSALGVLLEPQKRNRREKENHAAISVEELPALYAALDKLQGTSPRACQFAILTASRSKAVRLATWDEFDLENKTWNIPLEHDKMKQAKRDRTILLSDEAVQLLKDLPRYTGQTKVFLSNQMQTLSDMTMSMVLRRLHKKQNNIDGIGWIDKEKTKRTGKDCVVTPHGCARATFRTWAKDDTIGNNKSFDQEAVELCLLHSKRDVYNGAYDRARLLTERRKIMDAWGKYCISAVREKTSQIKGS